MEIDSSLENCLLGILQRGITEARAAFLVGDTKRAIALLDTLDNLPRYLAMWTEDSERQIELQLQLFREAYPDHSTDYVYVLKHRLV